MILVETPTNSKSNGFHPVKYLYFKFFGTYLGAANVSVTRDFRTETKKSSVLSFVQRATVNNR